VSTGKAWSAASTRGAWVWAAAIALPLASGCEERALPPDAQIVLYVTTDAPLAPPPGTVLGRYEPRGLFDRMRIAVTKPGEAAPCEGCTREFDVDRELVDSGRASMGIIPRVRTEGYLARVQLYTAAWARAGVPNPQSSIDVTVALPPIEDERVTEVTVMLRTEDVAKTLGRDVPLSTIPGRPAAGTVGTWPGGLRRDCATPVVPGRVCVPSGAFWMGMPPENDIAAGEVMIQQRLVSLAPYVVSAAEVTVAEFRASGLAEADDPMLDNISCPYSVEPRSKEAIPLACVSWRKSRQYCQSIEGDLLSEAQYEYVAGGTASQRYVWGEDNPACDEAVFGHNYGTNGRTYVGRCNIYGGQFAAGHGKRDRLALPGAAEEITELAGNVSEWSLDVWNDDPKGACWHTGVLQDPLCATADTPANASMRAVRGGSHVEGPFTMRAASRREIPATRMLHWIGIRCAWPG